MGKQLGTNRQIVKNTSFLYLRMLVMLFVSLYTSRVVLQQLGFVDFGIYNVVGSLVLMFSFIQGSLSSSASRFLSYEIGAGNPVSLNRMFCMTFNIHLIYALLIFVFSETFGLWYFYNKMVIPESRFNAAFVVFQISNINAILSIIIIPYRATIIAQEQMKAFAYISIIQDFAKLGIAFVIIISTFDKLVMYACLLCFVQIIINFLYVFYCRKHFASSSFYILWDMDIFKRMFVFTGWSLCSYTIVIVNQLVNLMINMFFGPVVNAARAIMYQVQTNVVGFVSNFQIALNPQIIKNYAASNEKRYSELVILSSKVSFSLLFVILMPLLVNLRYVLNIWLNEVPVYTEIFIILACIGSILSSFCNPLGVIAEAANRLKLYNAVTMPFYLFSVPVIYYLLKKEMSPNWIFVVLIIFEFFSFFLKVYLTKIIAPIPVKQEVMLFIKCCITILVGVNVMFLFKDYVNDSFPGFIVKVVSSLSFAIIWLYVFIFEKSERKRIVEFVRNKIHNRNESSGV